MTEHPLTQTQDQDHNRRPGRLEGIAGQFVRDGKKRYSRFQAEAKMNKREWTKLVHEGNYVAAVNVELLEEPEGWSPYLSLEDAYRLDDVREALRRGDIKTAARYSRVFSSLGVNMKTNNVHQD